MRILKKVLFVFIVFVIAFHSKLKAQKQYFMLYSNKPINHEHKDTCVAKLSKENNALILYSGKDIDTLYFQQKDKVKLFKYNIGKLLTTGYYFVINDKSIFLKNGIAGIKEYEDKYEIQHYSHASHMSHASHYSQVK